MIPYRYHLFVLLAFPLFVWITGGLLVSCLWEYGYIDDSVVGHYNEWKLIGVASLLILLLVNMVMA
jgi:hypothetical protein